MIRLLIDHREAASGIYELLNQHHDVQVSYTHLKVGDYRIGDQFVFERKTLLDFISSIKDGRLFRQAKRLLASPAKGVLILEGTAKDIRDSGMKRAAIQGALINLTLMLGIPMLRSSSPEESASLMLYAARQLQKLSTGTTLRSGKRPGGKRAQQLRMLQALPGIGPSRALSLLETFGSVEAVVQASLHDLQAVEQIGRTTAEKIRWLLSEPDTPYSQYNLWEEI